MHVLFTYPPLQTHMLIEISHEFIAWNQLFGTGIDWTLADRYQSVHLKLPHSLTHCTICETTIEVLEGLEFGI
jgi:hypothetical protein